MYKGYISKYIYIHTETAYSNSIEDGSTFISPTKN